MSQSRCLWLVLIAVAFSASVFADPKGNNKKASDYFTSPLSGVKIYAPELKAIAEVSRKFKIGKDFKGPSEVSMLADYLRKTKKVRIFYMRTGKKFMKDPFVREKANADVTVEQYKQLLKYFSVGERNISFYGIEHDEDRDRVDTKGGWVRPKGLKILSGKCPLKDERIIFYWSNNPQVLLHQYMRYLTPKHLYKRWTTPLSREVQNTIYGRFYDSRKKYFQLKKANKVTRKATIDYLVNAMEYTISFREDELLRMVRELDSVIFLQKYIEIRKPTFDLYKFTREYVVKKQLYGLRTYLSRTQRTEAGFSKQMIKLKYIDSVDSKRLKRELNHLIQKYNTLYKAAAKYGEMKWGIKAK